MSKNTVKKCEYCNSPIITVKRDGIVSQECSYCGEPYEKVEDFSIIDGEE